MKRITLILTSLLCLTLNAFSQEDINKLPDDYYTFRDNMYNFAKTPEEMHADYEKYIADIKEKYTGYQYNFYMARFVFIMARVYHYNNNFPEAEKYFDIGMEYSEKAMKENENAQSVLIYAENLSMNCIVKPVSWVIAYGPKVDPLTKKVLKYDPKNGAAIYMGNAQDIFAPAPFNNIKRGIKNMKSFLDNPAYELGKDDRFNIIAGVGYGYMLQKDKENATIWFNKALEIYPGSKYVMNLMEGL
ncbi:MAG: hypothetical protein K5839_06850 [Treponemataceae bacterium]|nr:hypothetical protein [Treponemataceae bacterium]